MLSRWQKDYNLARPHGAPQDQAPVSFAADWSAAAQNAHASHDLLETLTWAMLGSHSRIGRPNQSRTGNSTPDWLGLAGQVNTVCINQPRPDGLISWKLYASSLLRAALDAPLHIQGDHWRANNISLRPVRRLQSSLVDSVL
jgi:hypothetical protein